MTGRGDSSVQRCGGKGAALNSARIMLKALELPFSRVLVVLTLVGGLTACGPSPEDVCEHVIGLMDAELKEKGAPLAADKREKSLDSCVDRAAKKKRESEVDYKKEAACIMDAANLEAVNACSDSGAAKKDDDAED